MKDVLISTKMVGLIQQTHSSKMRHNGAMATEMALVIIQQETTLTIAHSSLATLAWTESVVLIQTVTVTRTLKLHGASLKGGCIRR